MTHKSKEEQVKTIMADQPMLVGLLVVLVLAVLVAALLPKFVFRPEIEEVSVEEEVTVDALMFVHPLTGLPIAEPIDSPQVFAVMVDNHVDAWPPSGLEDAFLVIEAPFEGGISRMTAFYSQEQDVPQIGPVRSARPYVLDWVAELDALYAHVGGSPAALDLIASGGTFDLNEYWWGGQYFWRSSDRLAPHNTYTSTELMRTFFERRDAAGLAPTRLYGEWLFKQPEPSDAVSSVRISFAPPLYEAVWEYDPATGRYDRLQYDRPHRADDGDQIQADNIAIVITDVTVIDAVGRRRITTIGEGEGYLLQDGQETPIVWKKPSASQRLRFYDPETDEEMQMNPGVTWIEVIPSETDVTFSE